MATGSPRLIVTGRVTHDRIDGEVVAIELDTGVYYSLVGVAADVWGALALGTDADTVVRAITASFPDEPSVAAEVDSLLQQLSTAGLLEPVAAPAGDPAVPVITAERFAPLQAEAFTDMQDLMLLDPVHDIDTGAGWPVVDPSPTDR